MDCFGMARWSGLGYGRALSGLMRYGGVRCWCVMGLFQALVQVLNGPAGSGNVGYGKARYFLVWNV